MSGFVVLQPGVLSLLQDAGRFGQHGIGLTNGGPVDGEAMCIANQLLGNPAGATALEISFGGLEFETQLATVIAYTGGDAPLTINGEEKSNWRSHQLAPGDRVSVGFATEFCRSYLAVAGGFQIAEQFGSTATVVREGVGGTSGNKLEKGELLPCSSCTDQPLLRLRKQDIPTYRKHISIRVIPGYQLDHFPRLQQRRFFSGEFFVTDRADRMGYRLDGPTIACDIEGILSEGICHGAIQVPADGQPIVLLNDRQTIGGYPKIGAALSTDTGRLSQLTPGATVHFEPVDSFAANNALHLQHYRLNHLVLEAAKDG
jgi:biotin-dependent carboxylase-like uncharacterized protein